MFDHERDVGTAIRRHALLNGVEVGPVIGDSLDGRGRGVVGPEGAVRGRFGPGRQRAAVASAGEDPGRARCGARPMRVEGQHAIRREVGEVRDGVGQGEVLYVLRRKLSIRRRPAPVAVLHDDDGSADLRGEHSRRSIRAQVGLVSRDVDLAGGEEDDGSAGGPPFVGVVVELREGAEGRVGVVD